MNRRLLAWTLALAGSGVLVGLLHSGDAAPTWYAPVAVGAGLLIACGLGCFPVVLAFELLFAGAAYGPHLYVVLGIALPGAMEVVMAAWVVRRLGIRFDRIEDAVGLLAIAAGVSLVGATAGIVILATLVTIADPLSVWAGWIVGDSTALATLLPLVTYLARDDRDALALPDSPHRWIEIPLVMAFGVGAVLAAAWFSVNEPMHRGEIRFIWTLPVVWAAVRLGRGLTAFTASLMAATAFAVYSRVPGSGDIGDGIGLQSMLVSLGVVALALSAALSQRRRVTADLGETTAALEASESRYTALFAGSPMVQLLVDPASGAIVDANAAAAAYYGWPEAQLRRMQMNEIIDPLAGDMGAALRRGGGIGHLHVLTRHRLADGAVRSVEVETGPVRFGGHRLALSLVRDVTAELEARQQVARLAAVVESSAEAIATTDLRGVITGWNPAATRLYGYSRGEAIGRDVIDLLGPLAVDSAELSTLVGAGESVHLPMAERVGAGGDPIPVDLVVSPILQDGRVVGMSRIARDLRPELEDAARVRRSEALLADAAQIGQMGSWEVDLATGRAVWSDELYRMTGLEPGQPVSGTSLIELAHHEDRDRVAAALGGAPDGTGPVSFRLIRRNGEERAVVASRRHVSADHDGVGREVGVARDVTEERALEEQLRHSQRVESIGLLAGGVAHDFNNLLTAIGGFAELARLAAADGESPDADLLQVQAAVERARTLTSQLLTFGRRALVRPRPVELGAAVEALAPILQRLLGARIGILTELDRDATVVIDPGQLDQVIVNLAVNARDAMSAGGHLRIATGRTSAIEDGEPGAIAWLEVEDDGTGIEPEVLEQIFMPFFTTKERGHGTGLGLSTVQGIVDQAGGRVAVTSRVGEGTLFRIELPLAAMAPIETATPSVVPERSRSDGVVLLVEDDTLVRRVGERVLKRAGFHVVAAGTMPDAVSLADTIRPNVLVTDIVLPGRGDGIQLATELRARWPDLPVLMMTGYTEQAPPPWAILLPKPWDPDDLVAIVGRLAETAPAPLGTDGIPQVAVGMLLPSESQRAP